MAKGNAFQAPTGTRDFYPQDMLRRRYIEKMWRDTSIRHGFEEIDGPTFEPSDLYAVKSGEGILGELFQAYSGKSPDEVAQVKESGRAPYALRPEFTPTLARMYAAKAGGLAKPTKWFTTGPFFRAERPQRGRLREFLQWNVDYIGGEETTVGDVDVICAMVEFLRLLGLSSSDVQIQISDRRVMEAIFGDRGIPAESHGAVLNLLDRRNKLKPDEFAWQAGEIGMSKAVVEDLDKTIAFVKSHHYTQVLSEMFPGDAASRPSLFELMGALEASGATGWCRLDFGIARGLAYYTGMVFEVHESGGKERAIAGGGRYDNLIELFGGPPTPAVGFGMGDVVLANLLDDKKLMPEGKALMDKLAEPPASPRPNVFVISNDQPESAAAVRPLVARLRRGDGGVRPLHARHSQKATKNIGKLLQEASACHSHFAAIIESAEHATLKNLDTGEQTQGVPLVEIGPRVS